MSAADEHLAALKARRDMDRLTLMDRVAEARELAKPGVLVSRAKADVEDRARGAAYQALEIANDHRGVVVATVSALLLWSVRSHVGSKIAQRAGPTAMQITRTVLEKAAPLLVAPFASPWVVPFIGPIAHRLLGPKPPAKPD